MPSFITVEAVDCADPRVVVAFRAEALGSDGDAGPVVVQDQGGHEFCVE